MKPTPVHTRSLETVFGTVEVGRTGVKPLQADARRLLCGAILPSPYSIGDSRMSLSAAHMESLPAFFSEIADPRRAEGRRHRLPTVLALSAGPVLCGMRGYHAIAEWVQSLGQKARRRFECRRDEDGRFLAPSEYVIRNVLIRVDPVELDRALQRWNEALPARIRVWPSTARRCATPWMKTAGRRTSSASSATRRRVATPKKSWHSARRR
jgi:DDE_Tnp_1-associated